MIGRIVSLQGPAEAIRQAQSTLLGQGVGILKSLAGLQALHVFANANQGRVAVVTIWSDEAAAQAAMQAMAAVQQGVTSLGLSFKLEDYEVVA